ncbi:MAG: chemotaxis protein CheX [Acetivibrio ethanolgignens]
MKPAIDVNYINPFLMSTMSIFESMVQTKLEVGKPAAGELKFENSMFIIQVGITGQMKGQVLLVIPQENAKKIASSMMCGMQVEELDEISRSALGELGNMIMGNTATLFSNQGIIIDITPPLSMSGNKLILQADIQSIRVPMLLEGEEFFSIYICVSKN